MQRDHGTIAADIALFNEFNSGGSLFSIHSAPPVQLADLGSATIANHNATVGTEKIDNGTETPTRRPISLELEAPTQNFTSTNSILVELSVSNKRSSEIDEDDNDNFLTVSSVTARPLIAKSRELRSSK